MSTCNRLDLQTLGSQPTMPKNLPEHWGRPSGGLLKAYTFLGFGVNVGTHLWVHPQGGQNFNGHPKTWITLLRSITMFCGIDNILHNIFHI
jgi:hypothetical protein